MAWTAAWSQAESLIATERRKNRRPLRRGNRPSLSGHPGRRDPEELAGASPQNVGRVERTPSRRPARGLLELLGQTSAIRITYGVRRGALSPLRASLNPPVERHSHGRPLVAVEAAQRSLSAPVEPMERTTWRRLAKRQAGEVAERAADGADAFYDRPESGEALPSETDVLLRSARMTSHTPSSRPAPCPSDAALAPAAPPSPVSSFR